MGADASFFLFSLESPLFDYLLSGLSKSKFKILLGFIVDLLL